MKKILEMLRANINAQLSAIAAQTTEEAKALRSSLQSQLAEVAKLDTTAETDGAGIAATAMSLLQKMQETAGNLFNDLQATLGKLTTKTRELDDLNGKVTGGELIPKAKLTEREELAKQAGVDSCAAEIADLRKQVVNGLPVPGDAVLKLPAAEFASLIGEARENLATAKGKGLALDGKGKTFLNRAVWLRKAEFATELASLEADGLLAGGRRDPLQGGGDTPPNPEAKPNMVGLC